MRVSCTYFIFCFLIFSQSAFSQDQTVIPLRQGEFVFDGVVDDECWKSVQPLPMVVQTPVFGSVPSEKTEVLICYDNDFFYAGARFYDSAPDKMLISSKKRDESQAATEMLYLLFDSFNDKENGLGFMTNPAGLRSDFTVFKDAMGEVRPNEGPYSFSWNTFWDVKTTRNEQGWFAELRIPFSSMRFREENGRVIMGLICGRYIAHKNEMIIFPAIPQNWGPLSHMRPSKAQEIVFEGVKSRKPFYVAPYVIGGRQWEQVLNPGGTGYELKGEKHKVNLNGGLDVKYGLTSNLTMDLTLNTDFAQVEADDEQINLTRFSLFFPEKRTFFQERSSIFSFDFEPQTAMFYSRRIGLHEGMQVPVYGGARVTGMAGKWDIGFLDMQTRETGSLPSENFGILRLRRQVINESSYVGGILTSRLNKDGYNLAYGVDGIFKIWENDYLNLKLAGVSDSAGNDGLSADPMRFYVNWQRFTQKGLKYDFTWSRSGRDFNPGIGFQTRENYSHYHGGIGYGWIPGESAALQSHNAGIMLNAFTDNAGNTAQSVEALLQYEFSFKSGHNGSVALKHAYENVSDTFALSRDAFVPSGKYRYNELEMHINSTQTNRFFMGFDIWAGSYYDGNRFSFGLEPGWNVGSSLQLAMTYDQNFINFKNRESFSGGVVGLKALLMLSTRTSISTFIQYNSAEHAAVTNFRLRYNPREGNDFYLVFNEGRNTYRDIEDPRLPVYNIRSLLLKYTYTFIL